MTLRRHFIAGFMLALTALMPAASYAQLSMHPTLQRLIGEMGSHNKKGGTVAHRGIFQPELTYWNSGYAMGYELSKPVPENSLAALERARTYCTATHRWAALA
jgi:hypothetical protein